LSAAKGLSRWAARCFAALSMTVSVLVGNIHDRAPTALPTYPTRSTAPTHQRHSTVAPTVCPSSNHQTRPCDFRRHTLPAPPGHAHKETGQYPCHKSSSDQHHSRQYRREKPRRELHQPALSGLVAG